MRNKCVTTGDFLSDMSKKDKQRFRSKVKKQSQEDCWPWTGARNEKGYGRFKLNGKVQKAHRVAWAIRNRRSPGDLIVMHSCDEPACCNPSHLMLGTPRANMVDMVAKGRGNSHGSKLTWDDVREIRRHSAQGVSRRSLALDFGVTVGTISKIKSGKTWADISPLTMEVLYPDHAEFH